MNTHISIDEAVKLTGKSKSTIRNLIREIKQLPTEERDSIIQEQSMGGGRFKHLISVEYLTAKYHIKQTGSLQQNDSYFDTTNKVAINQSFEQVVEILNKQLEEKDKQLAQKDKQLDQAQQLMAMKEQTLQIKEQALQTKDETIQKLSLQLTAPESPKDETIEEEAPQEKSWWESFFEWS